MSHCPTKRGIARCIAKKRGWTGRLHRWSKVVWGVTKSPFKHPRLGKGGRILVVLKKGPVITLQVSHEKE